MEQHILKLLCENPEGLNARVLAKELDTGKTEINRILYKMPYVSKHGTVTPVWRLDDRRGAILAVLLKKTDDELEQLLGL